MDKNLTGKQTHYLRGLAHPLKPLMQVGRSGLTATFIKQLDAMLEQHELLKVKISTTNNATETQLVATEILTLVKCQLVQRIGKTLILYRQRKDDPKIILC
jgi:RNA-binding protein